MLFLRLGKTLALWVAAWVLIAHAWVRSTHASSLDTSVPWALPLVGLPLLLGALLALAARRRRPNHWASLSGDRLALLVLLGALLADALADLGPYMSVRVVREQIPSIFLWLYPSLAFLAPLALARTAGRLDTAAQGLLGGLAFLSPSGVLLLDGSRALTVAVPLLLLQLAAHDGRLGPGRALRLLLVVVGLLALAANLGPSPLAAMPSLAWILTYACLALALAARPLDGEACRRLLAAAVVGVLLVAVCGAQLTAWLALEVDLAPALRTRLVLFQQHPNFLAPFFAVGAVLSLGLTLAATRLRVPGALAYLLLAASTVATDSRAGIGALAVGSLALPVLLLVGRRAGRREPSRPAEAPATPRPAAGGARRLALPLLAGLVLAGAFALVGDGLTEWLGERMAKSSDYRMDAWRNSLAIIGEEPWFGIGPHTFETRAELSSGSRFYNEPQSPHPHNVLLYLTQAAGLPALVVFVSFLVALLGGLFAGLRRGEARLGGPATQAGVLAASLGLLAANTLDMGLALHTVVPTSLYLFAGLLAGARRSATAPRRLPPAAGLAWLAVALAVWWPLGLDPTRADTELERARLLAWMSGQLSVDAELLDDARAACRRAIELDPDAVPAYELLARWEEDQPEGVVKAHAVLQQLIDRAPTHGPSHALLGHTYLRARLDELAVEPLRRALASSHGSVHLTRHRAACIGALARLGRRDEAAALLVDALSADMGVIDRLDWTTDRATGARLLPVQGERPVGLVEAVELLYARLVERRESGAVVGHKTWLDTVVAFRRAGRNDLALQVLDDLQANVPGVERESIATERALIAEDEGDLDGAIAHWQHADGIKPNPYYSTQVARLRALQGEVEIQATRDQAASAFAASGEILDQPTAFRDNLDARSAAAVRDGDPGRAAAFTERTLFYEDDALERTRRLMHAGELYLDGTRWPDAERCLTRALALLAARPYPAALLLEGHEDSLPGRIARGLLQAWRSLGLDADGCQRRAWGLRDYFSPRAAPSLFRLAFFAENGQMDHLLKEAELQLLMDPELLPAQWARLEAYEGLGRFDALGQEMRAIAERFAERYPVERLHQQLVHDVQVNDRMDDWTAWKDMAVLKLLSGGYGEAADMFGQARALLTEAPRQAARLAGWQARALLLSDRPDGVQRARDLLAGAVRTVPESGSLRARLEALP